MNDEELRVVIYELVAEGIREGVRAAKMTRDQRRVFIEAFKAHVGGILLEVMEDDELKEN